MAIMNKTRLGEYKKLLGLVRHSLRAMGKASTRFALAKLRRTKMFQLINKNNKGEEVVMATFSTRKAALSRLDKEVKEEASDIEAIIFDEMGDEAPIMAVQFGVSKDSASVFTNFYMGKPNNYYESNYIIRKES